MILKDNVATKDIEYKHKNIETSSCKSLCISELQCFNSSVKCQKTVSIKSSFWLSAEMWSRFSRLVCFNSVRHKNFTSFVLEKNLWIYDKLDILMHENNILSEVTTPKYTVYKNIIKAVTFKYILL